jgi:hypothetical protein
MGGLCPCLSNMCCPAGVSAAQLPLVAGMMMILLVMEGVRSGKLCRIAVCAVSARASSSAAAKKVAGYICSAFSGTSAVP